MSGTAAISIFIPLAQSTSTSHLDNSLFSKLISTFHTIPFNLFSNQPPQDPHGVCYHHWFPGCLIKIQNHSLACKTQSGPWHFSVSSTPFFLVIGFQHKSSCYLSPHPLSSALPTQGLCSCCSSAWKVISTDTHMVPSLIYSGLSWNITLMRRAFFDCSLNWPMFIISISLSCFDFHHHLTLHYIF